MASSWHARCGRTAVARRVVGPGGGLSDGGARHTWRRSPWPVTVAGHRGRRPRLRRSRRRHRCRTRLSRRSLRSARVGRRMRAPRNPFASLPPEVAVLTAVAFSVALGFGVVAPAIPLFAKEFGVSNFAAGAVVSVFALVRFASAPMAGRLVNRLGERWVLATGIGIVGVSSLLAGFAGDYT